MKLVAINQIVLKTFLSVVCLLLLVFVTNAFASSIGDIIKGIGDKKGFCVEYSNTARQQYKDGMSKKCPDMNYPVWSIDVWHHYNWCLKADPKDVTAGKAMREKLLRQCISTNTQATAGKQQIDVNEIILYTFPHFVGNSVSFKLTAKDRYLLLEKLPVGFEKVGSIRTGDDVRYVLFSDTWFQGEPNQCKEIQLANQFPGYAPEGLQSFTSFPCKFKSLIAFKKGSQNTAWKNNMGLHGIALSTRNTNSNFLPGKFTWLFFPPPASEERDQRCYPVRMDHIMNRSLQVVTPPGINVNEGYVEARVYRNQTCEGPHLTFPGPGSNIADYWLADYGINSAWKNASPTHGSMLVRWTGPVASAGRRKAPESSSSPTIIPKGYQMQSGQAVVYPVQDSVTDARLVSREHQYAIFEFGYVINPSHSTPVYAGAWLYHGGKAFGGYDPVTIKQTGVGAANVRISVQPGDPEMEEIEIFLFEPGKQPFFIKRFPIR